MSNWSNFWVFKMHSFNVKILTKSKQSLYMRGKINEINESMEKFNFPFFSLSH